MAADNIAVTAGTGTTVATDDVGGVHYQKIKLAIGASDTANLLSVGAGAVDTGTPRFTVASDDPIVTAITGTVAHSDADSGNASKIGTKSVAALSGLTLVTAADRSDAYSDLDGAIAVRQDFLLGDLVSGVAAITDGSSTSVIASSGAGIRTYITDIIVANSSGTAVTVDIRDGAAGSVKATIMAPAGGGAHKTLKCPLAGSAATAWCADPSSAASTVTVTLSGFKSKI